MRLFYVDSGLESELGHNAHCCRSMLGELGRRGIAATVLGFAGIDETLKKELNVQPLFRSFLYHLSDGDPLAGWLNAFEQVSQTTREDMARLTGLRADDAVYVAAAYPGQLMGTIQWLDSLPRDARPFVLVDLLGHPGMTIENGPNGQVLAQRHDDPRAMLYRFAAANIAKRNIGRLAISYTDPAAASVYSRVLGVNVVPLPLPYSAVTPSRNRAGARPVRLAFLGHQRGTDKGYHLVPEIAAGVLQSHPDAEVRVHNCVPAHFPAAHEAMRAFAKDRPNVVLDEQFIDRARWARILDETDLMVCPYDPAAYQLMSSGIHTEAIANAIPSVVPAGTALARALQIFGNAGVAFERFDAASIVTAIRGALDRFDSLAAAAQAGAVKWRQSGGPAKVVDAILAMARQN